MNETVALVQALGEKPFTAVVVRKALLCCSFVSRRADVFLFLLLPTRRDDGTFMVTGALKCSAEGAFKA